MSQQDMIAESARILELAGYSKRERASHQRALERCDAQTVQDSLEEYRACYPAAAAQAAEEAAPEPVFRFAVQETLADLYRQIATLKAELAELRARPAATDDTAAWSHRQAVAEGIARVAMAAV